jgi:hypothetical protein
MTLNILTLASLLAAGPLTQAPVATRPAEREGVRDMVRIYVMDQARREVGLSDEQVLKLLPLFDELESIRERTAGERRRVSEELKRLAETDQPEASQVRRAIATLDQIDERSRREQNEVRDRMLALLEPGQQARFMIFVHGFRERIKRELEAFRRRQGRRPARAPLERRERLRQ